MKHLTATIETPTGYRVVFPQMLYFPTTGQVLALMPRGYVPRSQGHVLLECGHADSLADLKRRYPNARIHAWGRRTNRLPYALWREAAERLGDRMLCEFAFMPSSKYRPELRQRRTDGTVEFQWLARNQSNPNYPSY